MTTKHHSSAPTVATASSLEDIDRLRFNLPCIFDQPVLANRRFTS
jgi:hypothetical protein